MTFREELLEIITEEQLLCQEPMKCHTTFRVGGPARYYLRPDVRQLPRVLEVCRSHEAPVFIIGNGSNLLVSDRGLPGVVVEIAQQISKVRREGSRIFAQAGAGLARVASEAAKASLSGLAFASGIPGTVGGAVLMNAGAYGGEMKDVVETVTVLTEEGEQRSFQRDELEFAYRHSRIQETGGVILEATFLLEPGDSGEISRQMEELRQKRLEKQPLEYPSAGSTFKRPEGYFAGKLIEDAGLRGFRLGDAQVSEKHCGFVINRGAATASQIWQLMCTVQERVYERSGVRLEPEVRLLGDF